MSRVRHLLYMLMFFFFNDTATTEIYTDDTLFPYTTLFRSECAVLPGEQRQRGRPRRQKIADVPLAGPALDDQVLDPRRRRLPEHRAVAFQPGQDRKSTRLNSSH